MIGNDIVLTVLDIDGARVRLGVAAPKDVQIYRAELFRSGRPLLNSTEAIRNQHSQEQVKPDS